MSRSGKELQLAYKLAIVLLVVGIASYAYTAFSAKPPNEPIRVLYKTTAGKVLFDHKTHLAESGYGVSCYDCHHHPPEDESALKACSTCHPAEPVEGTVPESCLECHDAGDIEGTEVAKRVDAYHTQCIDCHKSVGAGPVDCNSCHVL
ncbi:MAG: cytochrome c3 family protein [Desulfobacterales bacterium]